MTQIILDIPESYAQELEITAKIQQKTFQEIMLDAIQMFISHSQDGHREQEEKYDVTKDPIYNLGTEEVSDIEPTENFSENIDIFLYGEDYPK